jgi:hypothetical protein
MQGRASRDVRKKAEVVTSIFFEVQGNVKSLFLVDTQESGHELWNDTSNLLLKFYNKWQTKPIYILSIHFVQNHLNIILISLPNIKSLLQIFQQKLHMNFSPVCLMSHPAHTSWSDHPNIWPEIQIMKLLIMHFSPKFYHFPLSPNTVLTPLSATLHLRLSHIFHSFAPAPQNNILAFQHFNVYIFIYQIGWQTIQSAINSTTQTHSNQKCSKKPHISVSTHFVSITMFCAMSCFW